MRLKKPVYLDNNATTPMDPRVLDEMLPYFLEKFGNAASRTHCFGWEAEEAVDIARENVANLIGAHPHEIVFTSGATESNNLAIKGILDNPPHKGRHIITVSTEHKAVMDTCRSIEKMGAHITYLPVGSNGLIDPNRLENAIRPDTALISAMYANNETGVIQPVREIAEIAKKYQISFFSDASQAVGKIPVNVNSDGVHIMSFSAHKLYGPKGVGALYVRRKNPVVSLNAQIDGGGHERNMRSGTLNVPGIVGFGKACALCEAEMATEGARLFQLRDYFESKILALNGVRVNGDTTQRLPHSTNLEFQDIDGEKMIFQAGNEVAFSRSSACTSATLEPSHVLKAMGMSDASIHNSFRFSLGRFSTPEDIDVAVAVISGIVKEHRI